MEPLPKLAPREPDSHKGHYGRVLIIGGSLGMAGAPALAAMAALRSGSGLVQVACPAEIQSTVAALVPCAMTSFTDDAGRFGPTVHVVGPGCGDTISTKVLKRILQDLSSPMVLDADGLNTLATIDRWWELTHKDVVLTPHLGEMRRLLAKTLLDADSDRKHVTQEAAKLCGATVLLKGHETVVSNGDQIYINNTGNPGMATGGSGDVLSGVIGALIGQGLGCYHAACLGAHLHGTAGDLAAEKLGQISLTATDIIEMLPEAFRSHQQSS